MRRKIEKIVPRYAWGPLILAVVVNMAVYEGVALFKDDLTFYSLELPIDRMLPFVAPFIVFYLLAFVQWLSDGWCPDQSEIQTRIWTIGNHFWW